MRSIIEKNSVHEIKSLLQNTAANDFVIFVTYFLNELFRRFKMSISMLVRAPSSEKCRGPVRPSKLACLKKSSIVKQKLCKYE